VLPVHVVQSRLIRASARCAFHFPIHSVTTPPESSQNPVHRVLALCLFFRVSCAWRIPFTGISICEASAKEEMHMSSRQRTLCSTRAYIYWKGLREKRSHSVHRREARLETWIRTENVRQMSWSDVNMANQTKHSSRTGAQYQENIGLNTVA